MKSTLSQKKRKRRFIIKGIESDLKGLFWIIGGFLEPPFREALWNYFKFVTYSASLKPSNIPLLYSITGRLIILVFS